MKVCGGFTEHDMTLGWRGSCACGWYGPWRDWSLMAVERDVLEHWGECPEHSFAGSGERGTMDPTYTKCPGAAVTARGVAQTWRSEQ